MTKSMVPITTDQQGRPCIDVDMHSPEFSELSYDVYEKLRTECPAAWNPTYGGFWMVSRYEDIDAVVHDDETFRSAPGVTIPYHGAPRPGIPLETDPPLTFEWRRMILPLLSQGAMRQREGEFRDLARQLIASFARRGECDLVEEFTSALPASVTMRLFDIDEPDWPTWMEWAQALLHHSANDLDYAAECGIKMAVALTEAIVERRSRPRAELEEADDLLSALVRSTLQGEPLTDENIIDFSVTLLGGGLDTTSAAMAGALKYLSENPVARQRLVDDPDMLDPAIEEFLRFTAPGQGMARTAARDTEVAGQAVKSGERVMLLFASANRDAAKFDDADEIVLDRSNNRHMTFALGVHRCLGSNMARLLMRIGIEEILAALPDYHVTEGATVRHFADVGTIAGICSLPITFTPVVGE